MRIISLLLSIFGLLSIGGCEHSPHKRHLFHLGAYLGIYDKEILPLYIHNPDFEKHEFYSSYKTFWDSLSLSEASIEKEIQQYYIRDHYPLIFAPKIYTTTSADSILSILQDGYRHGLSDKAFDTDSIRSKIKILKSDRTQSDKYLFYRELIGLEYLMITNYIRYYTGMQYGFTHPGQLFKSGYHIEIHQPDSLFYKHIFGQLRASKMISLLKKAPPLSDNYQDLQQALLYYQHLSDSIVHPPIPSIGIEELKIGSTAPSIAAISYYLFLLGYIQEQTHLLSDDLLCAINAYRQRHTLPPSSVVDHKVIGLMNQQFAIWVDKLKIALERERWQKKVQSSPYYIEVNIASQTLTAYAPDTIPLTMKVCCGKNPEHRTPLLSGTFTYIELNPYWNIPSSIAQNETYPNIRKNPHYLEQANIKVLDRKTRKILHYSDIPWHNISAQKAARQYLFRQDSGRHSALGRFKFMFVNEFDVYLHDTPSKYAFDYSNRCISHGCVRVEKPLDLATYCLPKNKRTALYLDKIRKTVSLPLQSSKGIELEKKKQLSKTSRFIYLQEPVTLLIDYKTVFFNTENKLCFAFDVYNYDDLILNALP